MKQNDTLELDVPKVLSAKEILDEVIKNFEMNRIDIGKIIATLVPENILNSNKNVGATYILDSAVKGLINLNKLQEFQQNNVHNVLTAVSNITQNHKSMFDVINMDLKNQNISQFFSNPEFTTATNSLKKVAESLNHIFLNNNFEYAFDLSTFDISDQDKNDFMLEYNNLPLDEKNEFNNYFDRFVNILINGSEEIKEFLSNMPQKTLLLLNKLNNIGFWPIIHLLIILNQPINPVIITHNYSTTQNIYRDIDSQYLHYIYKDNSNIREFPNKSSQVLFKLNKNHKIRVIDKSEGSNWYLIEFKQINNDIEVTQSGWVSKSNVRILKTPTKSFD
jgi:hypothetical protein